ncbi:MAG: 50S ribosomal protein L23 [Candidatus Improbicoccus devescovinae]|nr:MAG: 50S ribosomal protein L23 [Candidatus Improbicoccus devescovinae]
MRMENYDILIKPVVSEKSTSGIVSRKYVFKVRKDAVKQQIRTAVEEIFDVKVKKVNVLNVRGRARRRGHIVGFTPAWKKAIVTLLPGQKGIEYFDSMT